MSSRVYPDSCGIQRIQVSDQFYSYTNKLDKLLHVIFVSIFLNDFLRFDKLYVSVFIEKTLVFVLLCACLDSPRLRDDIIKIKTDILRRGTSKCMASFHISEMTVGIC